MKLYTAQYKYCGDDRLDITVKGKDSISIGCLFAPTWKMVMGSKEGKISSDEYKQMYRELPQKFYREILGIWNDILGREELTLVCFCASGTDCHRYLLAGHLETLGAEYNGERI